jgi:hypothetical protein
MAPQEELIPSNKQYPKLSKAASSYLEVDMFNNSNLHSGYFCYDCKYFIKENSCAIKENSGPYVNGKEFGIIVQHSKCTLGSR